MEIVASGAALLARAGGLRDPNAAFQLPIYVTWKVIYVGPTSLCFDSTAPLAGAVVNFGQQPLENPFKHPFVQLLPVHVRDCASCTIWFKLPGLSGRLNHHGVLNKEPHVCCGKRTPKGSPAASEKCPERGQMLGLICGCCGCNQVAILPQRFYRPPVAKLIIFADVFFGFCFCRFLLKIAIAPPWRVMEAVAGARTRP